MAGYVERGEVPGLVLLLSRYGAVHTQVLALRLAVKAGRPLQRDHAVSDRLDDRSRSRRWPSRMILQVSRNARLRLDEPVDRWLPELANNWRVAAARS